jgi:hypothetical protein
MTEDQAVETAIAAPPSKDPLTTFRNLAII